MVCSAKKFRTADRFSRLVLLPKFARLVKLTPLAIQATEVEWKHPKEQGFNLA